MKAVVIGMKREQIPGTLRRWNRLAGCWVPGLDVQKEDSGMITRFLVGNGKEVGNMGGGGGLKAVQEIKLCLGEFFSLSAFLGDDWLTKMQKLESFKPQSSIQFFLYFGIKAIFLNIRTERLTCRCA